MVYPVTFLEEIKVDDINLAAFGNRPKSPPRGCEKLRCGCYTGRAPFIMWAHSSKYARTVGAYQLPRRGEL